ncbi:MAG TPA: hypothetical protein VEC93_05025 [Anaerolineae bacterium]|nr:hypothetical protein [Anaerolineae bacterium]
MLQQDFEHEFDYIATEAWAQSQSPLERMYDRWVGQGAWEPNPPAVTFRIHDVASGLPIPCHICNSTEDWVVEGDEVNQVARVFVCEHEPIWAGRGMIRQISTIPVAQVGRLEETGRPQE